MTLLQRLTHAELGDFLRWAWLLSTHIGFLLLVYDIFTR